ncbi:hypothetical protein KFE25_004282 [Diacronema lutheri]|uniref:Uncharacterized protein n=1 Tax=Diacronema lutheri TaxID=2081491 RepID=A0A8J6C901_DIALT|nr:hypothetical protein KFE25_004282 [Diacronema lutheri]
MSFHAAPTAKQMMRAERDAYPAGTGFARGVAAIGIDHVENFRHGKEFWAAYNLDADGAATPAMIATYDQWAQGRVLVDPCPCASPDVDVAIRFAPGTLLPSGKPYASSEPTHTLTINAAEGCLRPRYTAQLRRGGAIDDEHIVSYEVSPGLCSGKTFAFCCADQPIVVSAPASDAPLLELGGMVLPCRVCAGDRVSERPVAPIGVGRIVRVMLDQFSSGNKGVRGPEHHHRVTDPRYKEAYPTALQTFTVVGLPAEPSFAELPAVWLGAAVFESIVYPYHVRGGGTGTLGGGDGGGGV